MADRRPCGYDFFTLAALFPFVLLVIASFTDNKWATVNGFSFFQSLSLEAPTRILPIPWETIRTGLPDDDYCHRCGDCAEH